MLHLEKLLPKFLAEQFVLGMIEQGDRQHDQRNEEKHDTTRPSLQFDQIVKDIVEYARDSNADPIRLVHYRDHAAFLVVGRARLHKDLQRHGEHAREDPHHNQRDQAPPVAQPLAAFADPRQPLQRAILCQQTGCIASCRVLWA